MCKLLAAGPVTGGGHPGKQRRSRARWQAARWLTGAIASLILAGLASSAHSAAIAIPNASFESPATTFVDNRVDSWQKPAQPIWYDPATFGGYTWNQTSGVFSNTAPGNASHIDNCDGSQALYLFAIPQVGIFQDYASTDWSNSVPTHSFNPVFEAGKAYTLTVGVIGGSGMTAGAGLQLSLYYRDSLNNFVTVGATDIQYSLASFPNSTHFTDYQVNIPAVQAGAAWAGQYIGVQVMATSVGGGYWDIDNVRLSVVPEPSSCALLGLGIAAALLAPRRRRRLS